MMNHVKCSGTPYEIGRQHGSAVKQQVHGSIDFYSSWFKQHANLTWPRAIEFAQTFVPNLEKEWPEYLDEINGIADGAGVEFGSILALNVRTEIGYGLRTDGCTAFAWVSSDGAFIGQNWDWNHNQSPNIITMHIEQHGKPTIHMMTEAGIIGKIGLNSAGVGVTLNALVAKGTSPNKLPCHLALRTVLNSNSREEARALLQKHGVAASCHITIADWTGCVGMECTAFDMVEMEMDNRGICTHSNHFVYEHQIHGEPLTPDSPFRLARIRELLNEVKTPNIPDLQEVLRDEKNFPGSICRGRSEKSEIETLFSIVMDLKDGFAKVKMGRPTENGERLELKP